MSKFISLPIIPFKVQPPSQKYSFKKIAAEYYAIHGKPKAQNYALPFMVHDEVFGEIDKFVLSNKDVKKYWNEEFQQSPTLLKDTLAEIKKIKKEMFNGVYDTFKVSSSYGRPWESKTRPVPAPPKPSSPSLEQLYAVAYDLSRSYGIETACFVCDLPKELRYFEVFTHEVIHSYLLSPDPHPSSSTKMGNLLKEMPGWLANEHELTTLRCEAAALAAYGGGVDTVWIWERANWRAPGAFYRWSYGNPKEYAPDKAKLLAPLTVAENTVVQRFHALIKEHLK